MQIAPFAGMLGHLVFSVWWNSHKTLQWIYTSI